MITYTLTAEQIAMLCFAAEKYSQQLADKYDYACAAGEGDDLLKRAEELNNISLELSRADEVTFTRNKEIEP